MALADMIPRCSSSASVDSANAGPVVDVHVQVAHPDRGFHRICRQFLGVHAGKARRKSAAQFNLWLSSSSSLVIAFTFDAAETAAPGREQAVGAFDFSQQQYPT